MDNLFIQYYGRIKNTVRETWFMNNGFSSTLDYVKSIGESIWLEYNEDIPNMELPIKKGNVYISCHSKETLLVSYLLAKNNPHLSFVLGGPAFAVKIIVNEEVPNHITFTHKTVEEWFGLKPYPCKWKLEIPNKLINKRIYYTYTIDNLTCYWNKCIFCSCTVLPNNKHIRKNIDYSFTKIPKHKGKKIIRLGSLSMREEHIPMIDELPEGNIDYISFIRGTKKEASVIKNLSRNRSDFIYNCGLEFPSNRMWNKMYKGYNTEDVLSLIDIMYGSFLNISLIHGWNDLRKEDIEELKKFLQNMKKDVCAFIKVYNMFCLIDTPIYNTAKLYKHISWGPFYYGFYPYLTDKEKDLNNKALDIIINYAEKNGIQYDVQKTLK